MKDHGGTALYLVGKKEVLKKFENMLMKLLKIVKGHAPAKV